MVEESDSSGRLDAMDERAEEADSGTRESIKGVPASLDPCVRTDGGNNRSATTTQKSIPLRIDPPVDDLFITLKPNVHFIKLL